MTGKVWLVGAGPGDPELLTLKALRVLSTADIVLVDDLVNRAILVHVREGARVVRVGKRGGCKSTPQEFIERLTIAEAKAGRVVIRLKGGARSSSVAAERKQTRWGVPASSGKWSTGLPRGSRQRALPDYRSRIGTWHRVWYS